MGEPEGFHTEDDLNGRDNVETSTLEACLFDDDDPEDLPHTRRRRNEKDLNANDYERHEGRIARTINDRRDRTPLQEPEGGWRVIDLDTEEGRAEHERGQDSPALDEEKLQPPGGSDETGGPGEPG
jgi:hypothetical protein